MNSYFDHEKLRVYQDAINFVAWWEEISGRVSGKLAVKDQLDRASTGIPLNIAEGNAKRSNKERRYYFEIGLGSAFECAACLDVLVAKKRLTAAEICPGKMRLHGIVSMLMGLMSNLTDRVAEEHVAYGDSGFTFEENENE